MNINFRCADVSTASKAKREREREKMRESGTSPPRPVSIDTTYRTETSLKFLVLVN